MHFIRYVTSKTGQTVVKRHRRTHAESLFGTRAANSGRRWAHDLRAGDRAMLTGAPEVHPPDPIGDTALDNSPNEENAGTI